MDTGLDSWDKTMAKQENTSLWVFGYGSLCWHPGFQFGASSVGYIKNYVRRFWQGNSTHRGVPGKVSCCIQVISSPVLYHVVAVSKVVLK